MPTIKQVSDAFELLFLTINKPEFSKSQYFETWNEKAMLPNIRFFLLGYFGNDMEPELKTELLTSPSREGFIDFAIGKTAIEFAVRCPGDSASKLTSYSNRTERAKLVRRKNWHDRLKNGVMILFDFSEEPLGNEQLEEYREKPPFVHGNHKMDDFSLLYFNKYIDDDKYVIRKNIKFTK